MKTQMKTIRFIRTVISLAAVALGEAALSPLHAAVPGVSGVTMAQASDRLVTITYTLADAPAVITLDVQTNVTGDVWASIGGKAVWNATGDVWKKVETGSRTITWRPDLSWPDHKIADGCARAVVTAWALDNTPDYMAVDISAAAQPNTQTYYPSADFVPGGVLSNTNYRTGMILMRKIMAKDVTWMMGSTTLETLRVATSEATHQVTLTNNYYIGVFPVTQAQWDLIQPSRLAPSWFRNAADRAMRPVERVCYNEIRLKDNISAAATADEIATYSWPKEPNPSSFLGLLRSKTGLDFDLPSEAQWEFAARAGNGDTKWGDGSGILNADKDENLDLLGRYKRNGGYVSGSTEPDSSCGVTNGTAIVGSYLPNDWGLYDTAGNLWEWCLDWYEDNINAHGGKVNIDPSAPAKTLSRASGGKRARRGGCWSTEARHCRPAFRAGYAPTAPDNIFGFRVLCSAGLR